MNFTTPDYGRSNQSRTPSLLALKQYQAAQRHSSPRNSRSSYSCPVHDSDPFSLFRRRESTASRPSTVKQESLLDDLFPSSTQTSMAGEVWTQSGQLTPLNGTHHRESSLSSIASAGPASPYSQNLSNPQIVTDALPESYTGLSLNDDSFMQAAKSLNAGNSDNFSANYPMYAAEPTSAAAIAAYTNLLAVQKGKNDKTSSSAAPELQATSAGSRPVSVASSSITESPPTPGAKDAMEDKRSRAAFTAIPKLDRTMTDIYSDELYNPDFTITSATPSQQSQASLSPNNEVFAQRLQAANSQHLSSQSPRTAMSRDGTAFRNGSPLAPTLQNFGASAPSSLQYGSAQSARQQVKIERSSSRAMRHALPQANEPLTPQTISPKDAILEFSDTDANNMPLFPAQDASMFGAGQTAATQKTSLRRSGSQFADFSVSNSAFEDFLARLPTGVRMPQQYPFVSQPRHSMTPSASNASFNSPMSRHDSMDSATSNSSFAPVGTQRPELTNADSGTYTCTYHGCIQRFETPAALQKHKREGHRQATGLTGLKRPDGAESPTSLLNSQAGPHRCDRINPSTGKSCATVFSRPYDLTRHEDTIHNARKQKVRCELCTEEKTFSRADALTRHFRVCHPDVDFPGKHRKRGGGSA